MLIVILLAIGELLKYKHASNKKGIYGEKYTREWASNVNITKRIAISTKFLKVEFVAVVNFVLWTTKVRKTAMASVVFVSRGILSGLAPSAQRQAIRVTSCR